MAINRSTPFIPYDNDPQKSLWPYIAAQRGDVDFLKAYLTRHPNLIDQPWKYDRNVSLTFPPFSWSKHSFSEFESIQTIGDGIGLASAVFVGFLLAPVGIGVMGLAAGFQFASGHISGTLVNAKTMKKTYDGCTLLQFAAANGQIEVAIYLMERDANAHRMLEYAKAYKQTEFLVAMQRELERRAEKLKQQNALTVLNKEVKDIKSTLRVAELQINETTYLLKEENEKTQLLGEQIKDFAEHFDSFPEATQKEINEKSKVRGNAYLTEQKKRQGEFTTGLKKASTEKNLDPIVEQKIAGMLQHHGLFSTPPTEQLSQENKTITARP